jgi:sulfite reductase (ferredoxin)
MPLEKLESFFEPLFTFFKQGRKSKESFGEFCHRVGFTALREFSQSYGSGDENRKGQGRKNQRRVSLSDEMYNQLKARSERDKCPMNQIVQEALTAYLNS